MLRAVGNWDDGKGAISKDEPGPRGGMSSPFVSGAPKKKITFGEYNSKRAGQGVNKPVAEGSGKNQGADAANGTAPEAKPQAQEASKSLKR